MKSKLSRAERLYGLSMPIIAITGGIGSGKSEASKLLAPSFDLFLSADALIKEIYSWPSTFKYIAENFPTAIKQDKIDFKKLRQLAFNNYLIKKGLEAYLYPNLEELVIEKVEENAPQNILYEIPLLFERGLEDKFDLVICVYADEKLRIQRVLERDQSDQELIEKIMASQMSLEDKKKKSDIIIENNGTLKDLQAAVDVLLKEFK